MPKAEWKVKRAALLAAGATLLPGIEERVALRERWSHRQGTPETHEHNFRAQSRPGSIARLYSSEAIDRDQLAAAHEIAEAYRSITSDVNIKTASLETRVDCSSHGKMEGQQFGRVLVDIAYDAWRGMIGADAGLLLSVIVYDVGLTVAARRNGMSMPRARRTLCNALDLWHQLKGRSVRAAAALAA
jgi:hypothetical protein